MDFNERSKIKRIDIYINPRKFRNFAENIPYTRLKNG